MAALQALWRALADGVEPPGVRHTGVVTSNVQHIIRLTYCVP